MDGVRLWEVEESERPALVAACRRPLATRNVLDKASQFRKVSGGGRATFLRERDPGGTLMIRVRDGEQSGQRDSDLKPRSGRGARKRLVFYAVMLLIPLAVGFTVQIGYATYRWACQAVDELRRGGYLAWLICNQCGDGEHCPTAGPGV